MTDFDNGSNGNENETVVEGETGNTEQVVESVEVETEPKTFTQEDVDRIAGEVRQQVREQSAAELAAFRQQAEEVIANLSRAAAAQKNQAEDPALEDDPPPIPLAQMTPNQRLLWESNMPNRIATKRMIQQAKQELSQSVAPVLNDQTVKDFFSARTYVPDSVKAATQNIFREARNNGNRAPADQLVQAAYTRALAEHADNQMRSGGKVGGGTAATNTKKVIVKAPNGSADLGGSTRNITGKIGGSKTGSGKSYKELMAELIAEGKMPDNGAGGHFSG